MKLGLGEASGVIVRGIISALDLLSALVSQGTNDAAAPGAGAGTKISWIRLMAGPFG